MGQDDDWPSASELDRTNPTVISQSSVNEAERMLDSMPREETLDSPHGATDSVDESLPPSFGTDGAMVEDIYGRKKPTKLVGAILAVAALSLAVTLFLKTRASTGTTTESKSPASAAAPTSTGIAAASTAAAAATSAAVSSTASPTSASEATTTTVPAPKTKPPRVFGTSSRPTTPFTTKTPTNTPVQKKKDKDDLLSERF